MANDQLFLPGFSRHLRLPPAFQPVGWMCTPWPSLPAGFLRAFPVFPLQGTWSEAAYLALLSNRMLELAGEAHRMAGEFDVAQSDTSNLLPGFPASVQKTLALG